MRKVHWHGSPRTDLFVCFHGSKYTFLRAENVDNVLNITAPFTTVMEHEDSFETNLREVFVLNIRRISYLPSL